jgi:hypothetical protein
VIRIGVSFGAASRGFKHLAPVATTCAWPPGTVIETSRETARF